MGAIRIDRLAERIRALSVERTEMLARELAARSTAHAEMLAQSLLEAVDRARPRSRPPAEENGA